MNIIENAKTNPKDMSAGYLARAVNMFSGRELADSKKMLNDLREIERLGANGECLRELNAILGEL